MTFMNVDLAKWLDRFRDSGMVPAGYRTPGEMNG
jgi:hypothetical protein